MAFIARRIPSFIKSRTQLSQTMQKSSNPHKELNQPLGKTPKCAKDAKDAVQLIKSENTVFIQGAAATPEVLINAMVQHAKENSLKDIIVCSMHTEGKAAYADKENAQHFRSVSFFMGSNVRKAVAEGRADCVPIFLQDIPKLFHRRIYCPDVSLIHVSPPDHKGYCSLGTSVDCVRAALVNSKSIIAQINPEMPKTYGNTFIHMSHFDSFIEIRVPIFTSKNVPPTEEEKKIGELIAKNLVKDGATLQMGIGSIPNAVLAALKNHKELGIHSEMFSSGIIDLVKNGCITNSQKPLNKGKIVGSFLIGDCELYKFISDNPLVEMYEVDYVNSTAAIRQMPKMVGVNSCIEIDLTGQVVSDSIGPRMYSGFGGQVDFIRGAAEGTDGQGVPIIAMTSATKKGDTKIVPFIKQGAGVVTSRAHVYHVVTEHGIASLFGKTLRERAHALIQIAHPDHREALDKAAFERLKTRLCEK